MKPPVDVDALPAPLRKAVQAAQKKELWGDAIEAFEEWLDEQAKRPPEVLAMLAYMTYFDAIEVMVDEVAEHSETALKLLDESKLDSKDLRALRTAIKKSLKLARQKDALVEKSREQKLEDLDEYDLHELAYKLGESKKPEDHAVAARAWVISAERADKAYKKCDCLARAALSFADAGDWAEATPRLEKLIAHPDDQDDWFADYAWYRFLDRAIGNKDIGDFTARWKGALAMPRKDHFPFAEPAQASYLAFAVEHELVEIAQHLVKIIMKHQGPKKRKALASLLDRARALLD